MIYDRTYADVENARQIRENKIKKKQTLTEEDIAQLERGFLTVTALNRIEDKQKELTTLINNMGYHHKLFDNVTWALGDEVTINDYNRIIANTDFLRFAFFVYSKTPETPSSFLNYNDLNSLEKILYDLGVMVDDVKINYRECGAYECGGD